MRVTNSFFFFFFFHCWTCLWCLKKSSSTVFRQLWHLRQLLNHLSGECPVNMSFPTSSWHIILDFFGNFHENKFWKILLKMILGSNDFRNLRHAWTQEIKICKSISRACFSVQMILEGDVLEFTAKEMKGFVERVFVVGSLETRTKRVFSELMLLNLS